MRKSEPAITPRGNALRSSFLTALLFALTGLAAALEAHPIHTGYAEADYRVPTGRLEIAVRLFTDDVESALTARAGRKISFHKTAPAELDTLLRDYVRDGFVVKSAAGETQTLAWVGRELKDSEQHLWIYVQCPLPGGPEGARVRHRLLRETFSDQLNSLRVRDHSAAPMRQTTLLFTTDAEQAISFRSG